MSSLKIAIIVDNGNVPRFGLEAIDEIVGCNEIDVFSCTNTSLRRKAGEHGAYYLLNLLTVRNRMTASVPISASTKRVASLTAFESDYEGAWQVLPSPIVEQLQRSGYDIVLKLGMGLLRIPPSLASKPPILSYHHGDPDHYRGRPAGFWEMVHGSPVMGQIVQILSNRLDAGKVVAFAETRVQPHSYRATLLESYRHSKLLINEAIRNALAGSHLSKPSSGKNYRLPSNGTVAAFVARMALRYIGRIFYGATVEKGWCVSLADMPAARVPGLLKGLEFPPVEQWRSLRAAPSYSFYADPFFSSEPSTVLVEAMNRRTGLGEIVMVDGDRHIPVSGPGGHFSYPCTLKTVSEEVIVPEIAGWSSPKIYKLSGETLIEVGALALEPNTRLLEPTPVEHEGRVYVFATPAELGGNVLCIWSSDSLTEPFRPHPLNPIRISPRGSRMAGSLVKLDGRLIRLGQSFARGYGDGIFAFKIEELTPTTFRESLLGEVRFSDRSGPHTLNLRDGEILFDWYRDRFTPMAGVRRWLAARQAQRGLAASAERR